MKTLIPHFIHGHVLDRRWHGSLRACVLFADLTGFTSLTEALMQKGAVGAEELSHILNSIFEPLVHGVYTHGGFIPHFAGDSFYAIFPDSLPDYHLSCLCAAVEAAQFFEEKKNNFGGFHIRLKIGLSCGEVEWGIAGHSAYSFYFRGTPIDQSARCQEKAKGENRPIVVDEAFRSSLTPQLPVVLGEMEQGFCTLVPGVRLCPPVESDALSLPPLQHDVLKAFLPDEVLTLKHTGEFRNVVSVFIALGGVDDRHLLHRVIQTIIEQIATFSAYLKEFDFGDKGAMVTCFFGAPVSFENNDFRALEFVYALRQKLRDWTENDSLQLKIGITSGTAFTGIVGGAERCQYAVVGTHVNLAARLMSYARWGEVLVDENIRKNRYFLFQFRGEIVYKGMEKPVSTFSLEARVEEHIQVFSGALIGRDIELRKLIAFAQPLSESKPVGIAFIFGEAGIGKTRLTYEARQYIARQHRAQWAYCPSDQILRKPFNPFIYYLRNYFGQSAEEPAARNRERFENRFQNIFERLARIPGIECQGLRDELTRTKPVLGTLVGIPFPDSIWEQLDARGRYQNTIQAVVNLFCCESRLNPLAIELEDAHWMDQNSVALLGELLRHASRFPILLLVTSRFDDDGSYPHFYESVLSNAGDLPVLIMDLNALQSNFVRQFAETRLQGPISQEFLDLLLRTTNSNPFYLEQLLEYFSEQNLLVQTDKIWTVKDPNIPLSASINAILTARIDRLSDLARETVKTAAVIGREFELPVLAALMLASETFARESDQPDYLLQEQIKIAEKGQIWRSLSELRYIFRHTLLREAAYGMQLHAQLQHLHQLIGETIERLYSGNLEDRYFDLAFHFEQAKMEEKTIFYLRKSGEYAQEKFQHQEALEYYDKVLAIIGEKAPDSVLAEVLLSKGKVLESLGRWEDAALILNQAATVAVQTEQQDLLAYAHSHIGRLRMLQGDYQQARSALQQALRLFSAIEVPAGLVEVTGHLANLYFRQGKYPEAEQFFQQCFEKAREIPDYYLDPQIIANLGLTYMNRGEYEAATAFVRQQLLSCEARNDKSATALLLTYLGIIHVDKGSYEEALDALRKALRLNNQLGNKQLIAIATGNMGVIFERQGHYKQAMDAYLKDLELCEELRDKQGTAIALSLIGQLLNVQGEFHRAIEYMQKALMLCEELSYQKGIAKALNTLGDIFYFLRQHHRSLHYYNRAIGLTRLIQNKLVLGFSLVEKGAVLLETNAWTELGAVVQEAQSIAEELGNPDLHFEARLLAAKTTFAIGQTSTARQALLQLLEAPRTPDQEAAVYYELFRLEPHSTDRRQKAYLIYKELYRQTPRYLFKFRLDILEHLQQY